jgi:signal transduction histidine kinase
MLRARKNKTDFENHSGEISGSLSCGSLFFSDQTGVACVDANANLVSVNGAFRQSIIDRICLSDLSYFRQLVLSFCRTGADGGRLSLNERVSLIRFPAKGKSGHTILIAIENESHLKLQTRPNKERAAFEENTFEYKLKVSAEDEILFCNDTFASHFNYQKPIERMKVSLPDLFEDKNDYYGIKCRALAGERVVHAKAFMRLPSGKRMAGLINCSRSNDESEPAVVYWTILDITIGVAFEEDLKIKRKELEKANATMEKFLYSTSHDLRSPVSSILGLVNLMKIETQEQFIQEYVHKIEESACRLDTIIKDLMGFTKTSYQQPKVEKVDLEHIMRRVICDQTGENNFASIDWGVTVTAVHEFWTDVEKLELILTNIIRNTVHFSDRNKTNSIARVTLTIDEHRANISVLDNGIGIAKNHLDKIFDMFYKASIQSRGAGLGLYIVKESLSQLQGTISVESEPGFGSMFRIVIPNQVRMKDIINNVTDLS